MRSSGNNWESAWSSRRVYRGASILSQVLLELFESQLADPGLAVSYDVLHDAVQAAAEFVRADGGQGGR